MKMDAAGLEIHNLKAFGVFDGPDVLEVGCGDGRVTAALSGNVACLVALDPCARDIQRAAGRLREPLFSRASGEQLPFRDNCFDTILFTLSLHHQNSRLALGEAVRVLRPAGRIIVMEPAVDGEVQQLFHCFHDETPALEAALEAIAASSQRVRRVLQFETDWEFDHKHELSRYMFAYHAQTREPEMEARLFRQLGQKADHEPLILKERITLLDLVV